MLQCAILLQLKALNAGEKEEDIGTGVGEKVQLRVWGLCCISWKVTRY